VQRSEAFGEIEQSATEL